MAQTILFVIFALLALLSGLMVVTARHPVKAVLSLVVTFVATAGTWMLLEAEFLSLVLVVVYVGAVMVLFLFVVMMLDVEKAEKKANLVAYWPFAITIAVLFFVMLVNLIGHMNLANPAPTLVFTVSNVLQIGLSLFTQYLYPFELAAVILLVAMVAAIALTFRGPRPGKKVQNMNAQIKVKASDRLRLVDMPFATKEESV